VEHAQTSSDTCKAPLELQAAAVKAVRQVFETISVPSVIDMVPGGIDKARAKVKVAVPYPVGPENVMGGFARAMCGVVRHEELPHPVLDCPACNSISAKQRW
jgi:hypothetical protein